ncbi:hypothetical protein OK006_11162 [Actinobacteria bacterium OK006]|nr:hypothetical protein OK006_11162 [Actinobacteria bacterium OK006]
MSSLDIVEPEHLEVSNLFYRDPALYDSVQPDLNARSPGGRPRRAAGTVDRLEAVSVISWRCGPGMVDEPAHRPRHHCRLTPACAGRTAPSTATSTPASAHPRLRGEDKCLAFTPEGTGVPGLPLMPDRACLKGTGV